MIYSIVVRNNPEAKSVPIPGQVVPRGHDPVYGTVLSQSDRVGFTDPTGQDAKQHAEAMAKANPGVMFLVLRVVDAFECLPGDVVNKVPNEQGEMVRRNAG